jgi:hypothetical protein
MQVSPPLENYKESKDPLSCACMANHTLSLPWMKWGVSAHQLLAMEPYKQYGGSGA